MPPAPADTITSQSGWYLKSYSIAGDLVTLNALKQSSNGGLKSTITNTPSVNEAGNYLLSIGNNEALNKAVADLIGADADWQLDAANKRVVYIT